MPAIPPLATRTPPDGGHGQSLRTRLITAARDLLERDGLEAATLRATAREAGVSHMAPYRHFKDKDALLAAVAEQGFRAMTRFIDAAGGAGTERNAAGLAYVAFALDNPALYGLMFGANLSPRERFPGLLAAGGEAFERCIAASGAESRRISGGEEATPSAVALWSIVHGLATLVIDGLIAMPPKGPARDAAIAAILHAAP
jgi:AcrR family transcriptional regulator